MMKKLAALLAVTAGCATAETNGPFHITGRLVDAPSVTHVVAANPTNTDRVVVPLGADGRFDLPVEPGYQWVVTFADWTKGGKDMQVATLQADALDAFVPQGPGSVDLGTVTVADARAHGTVGWRELVGSLGIDEAIAIRMGRTDNLALRYANPDIDNDGTIDGLQHGHDFRLSISGSYTLTTNGHPATVADVVAGTYEQRGIDYAGTTIQTIVPRAMGMEMETGTVTFEEPYYGTMHGEHTAMVEPGTPIGAPEVKFGELGGVAMMGLVARSGENAPSGTYELGFANGQLTFSDVHVPSAAALEGAQGYAVPYIHIRPTVSGCTVDCDIAAIDLEWYRMTEIGWQATGEVQPAKLEVVAMLGGKTTYLTASLDEQASLAWADMPVSGSGILASELAYVRTSEICFLQVSYASELGMTMAMSVANPACR